MKLQTIKKQIDSATTVADLTLLVNVAFTVQELQEILRKKLVDNPSNNDGLVNTVYYNGMPLDVIFPADIVAKMLAYIDSSQFEQLPTVSINFRNIIYNHVNIFSKVKLHDKVL